MEEKSDKIMVRLRIDRDLQQWFAEKARNNDRTLNSELNRLLREYRDNCEASTAPSAKQ